MTYSLRYLCCCYDIAVSHRTKVGSWWQWRRKNMIKSLWYPLISSSKVDAHQIEWGRPTYSLFTLHCDKVQTDLPIYVGAFIRTRQCNVISDSLHTIFSFRGFDCDLCIFRVKILYERHYGYVKQTAFVIFFRCTEHQNNHRVCCIVRIFQVFVRQAA